MRWRAAHPSLRSERGFIVPVVLWILVIALVFLGVVATAALRNSDTAHHDVWARQALQAADAGVDLAARRSNSASLDLRQVLNLNLQAQCVASAGTLLGILPVGTSGWCDPVSESLGTGMSFSYQASSLLDLRAQTGLCGPVYLACVIDHTLSRKVVSTGMAGPGCPNGNRCVKRRVMARLSSAAPTHTTSTLGLGSLNILGSLNLQLYNKQAGSYRECTVTPPDSSNPASGC